MLAHLPSCRFLWLPEGVPDDISHELDALYALEDTQCELDELRALIDTQRQLGELRTLQDTHRQLDQLYALREEARAVLKLELEQQGPRVSAPTKHYIASGLCSLQTGCAV